MAVTQRPTTYINWTQGLGPNNVQPPPELAATGWQPGMPIPAAYQNYITWLTDQWIQFLSDGINSTVLATSLDHSMRLIGGGTFTFNAGTSTLSWAAPLYIAIPSIPDADNTIPAGSVVVPAGSVAYVSCNMPFTTSGDVTSGSKTVKNVAFDGSIAVGQTVTGTGIPANTTVASLAKTTLTLSQAATASGSQVALTFANTGNLTVSVAPTTALVPNPQTTVLARSLGTAISVGVGSTELWLRDGEQRTLVTAGYVTTVQAPAGVNVAALQPVYMSQGTADGRTQGALYPCDASAANGLQRAYCVGFAHTATTSGNVCHVVQGGFLSGFTGLTPGAVYYLDPSTVGGITATKPTTQGQYVAPLGVATSTTQLLIHISPTLPISTVLPSLTVTGDASFQGLVQLKPKTAGNALQGFNAAGTNTWNISDAGIAAVQGATNTAGFKSTIDMGSLWRTTTNTALTGRLQKTIYNQDTQALGVIEKHFFATHSGSVVGLSGRLYSAPSSGSTASLTATVYIFQAPSTILASRIVTLTNATFVPFNVRYAAGLYPFAEGTDLFVTVAFFQSGSSMLAGNVQASADMSIELTGN